MHAAVVVEGLTIAVLAGALIVLAIAYLGVVDKNESLKKGIERLIKESEEPPPAPPAKIRKARR